MFKPSITRNISIILAFVIMTIFCTNSSVYARKNNSIEIIANNIIQVRENNKISAGGATIVVQDIYKAIKKEVIALTAGVSGFFLKNHGIIIYREETCERRCRGTDCYTTYYAEAIGHGTY